MIISLTSSTLVEIMFFSWVAGIVTAFGILFLLNKMTR